MLNRLAMMIVNGQLPDPRTTQGRLAYGAIGFGIGWWLGYNFM